MEDTIFRTLHSRNEGPSLAGDLKGADNNEVDDVYP